MLNNLYTHEYKIMVFLLGSSRLVFRQWTGPDKKKLGPRLTLAFLLYCTLFIYTNPGFSILAIDELVITYDLDIRITIFVV